MGGAMASFCAGDPQKVFKLGSVMITKSPRWLNWSPPVGEHRERCITKAADVEDFYFSTSAAAVPAFPVFIHSGNYQPCKDLPAPVLSPITVNAVLIPASQRFWL